MTFLDYLAANLDTVLLGLLIVTAVIMAFEARAK